MIRNHVPPFEYDMNTKTSVHLRLLALGLQGSEQLERVPSRVPLEGLPVRLP